MRRFSLTVLFSLLVLAISACEKYELDRELDAMCKADGGMKIYETVTLPPEMFDKNGEPFPGRSNRLPGDRLGPDYQLRHEVRYLKQGNPVQGEAQLFRSHWTVIRVADRKSLGEAIVYGRSGGDILPLGHFSSKTCPEKLGMPGKLIHSVFVNRGR